MSIVRVGSTQKFSENWANIFGGKKPAKSVEKAGEKKKRPAKAAKKKAKKS